MDTVTPCFHLLTKVTRHHDRAFENSIAAEGSLWAFAWSQNSRQLLSVRNIVNDGDVEKEVVLDIGEPIRVRSPAIILGNIIDNHTPGHPVNYF